MTGLFAPPPEAKAKTKNRKNTHTVLTHGGANALDLAREKRCTVHVVVGRLRLQVACALSTIWAFDPGALAGGWT